MQNRIYDAEELSSKEFSILRQQISELQTKTQDGSKEYETVVQDYTKKLAEKETVV
jgi:hypothetical protein